MGNRSYLYINKAEGGLFEANNSLPFFWIGLLDKNIIDHHKPAWQKYDELMGKDNSTEMEDYLNIQPSPLTFKISKLDFEKNSLHTQHFIEQNYPQYFSLFKDFQQYIHSKFSLNDVLMLDILEMSNFFTTIDKFLESLYNEVQAIEDNNRQAIQYLFEDDVIASTVGWAIQEDFYNSSVAYQEALKNREKPKVVANKNGRFSRKRLFLYIFILALCPAFTVIAYLMLKKEGFSFWNFMLILSNIGFYGYSIYKIREQLRASKIYKK